MKKVEVTLSYPSATLPDSGQFWLGGEFFSYTSATQITTSPNKWRLNGVQQFNTWTASVSHAIGEGFVLLDDAVRFVPFPPSEIGQTRNYKAVTDRQTLADADVFTFTYDAPHYPTPHYELLMNGSVTSPEPIYYNGDPVYAWVER